MLRFMLDTNICIYVIKNRPEVVRERFNRHSGTLCISSVTLAELHYGVMKSARPEHNLQIVESFAARLSVLDFDPVAAGHYGDIRVDLERRGTVIGPYDMMIAGHARSRGLTLVTNNLKEFERVKGLLTDNWI
ncbi:tRNA(fMet)-specific endonuclease VapC [Thalassospira sp.]|uniref:type II toxin-antitoxin system tRNA(fMet)-specific endonuclease VapC n=1 Tax=Thalassospira sp. TaxID=1912094 RepID=UPI002736F873|nr:tRNA(fMet)-specific endonuclease VapC [Thalassospira sp.]MDP2698466.1 tRNA(fMet)-specific endonuclease VapC [Thalassospira sp.]